MKEVLTIQVCLEEIQDVNGHRRSARMIPFSGTAKGPYFQGKVLPHGVDTQKSHPQGKPRLSARYILEGTDCQGNACRIFIENNGQEDADGVLRTCPSVITDSPALGWLEDAALSGTVESAENGVLIRIFAPEGSENSFLQPGAVPYICERLVVSAKEKQICGSLFLPQTESPCPAVIVSHGYNGSYKDFFRECEYFASHGIAAFSFDFCGGSVASVSSGSTTQMSVLTEQADLEAMLECVRRFKGIRQDRIFLFGGSQGGLVSALTAAAHPQDVRGLILYYPALCIPDDWNRRYPTEEEIPDTTDFWNMTLGKLYFQDARRLEPFKVIGAYEKNVLIFHGEQDEIVPLDYSIKAQKCYKNAKLEILPGEGHGFTPRGGREAAEKVLAFLLEN